MCFRNVKLFQRAVYKQKVVSQHILELLNIAIFSFTYYNVENGIIYQLRV